MVQRNFFTNYDFKRRRVNGEQTNKREDLPFLLPSTT
jgi:hypothetical protein